MEVVRKNHDLAESLKDSSVFVFKDWSRKKGIYKTELLQEGINLMWFTNQNDKGIIYHKYFNPVPVRAIALMLTAIKCCFNEWMQGLKEDIKFMSTTYGAVYNTHLGSLLRFDECTVAYKLIDKMCTNLHDTAHFHAGVKSLIPLLATSWAHIEDEAFKDTI
ncbi:hypothetical protein F4604DRAFT_1923219 [Suillus subluteus]|nr:hypothetical protein F4604DRAFT_1923219 [Suillus subluteus]